MVRSSIAGSWGTGGLDHLKRLRACLAATAALVQSRDARGADEGTRGARSAYTLDVRAFEIAVETVLFFEAVGEAAGAWDKEMRRQAGLALAATAGLRRSIGAVVRHFGASGKEPDALFAALHALSAVIGRLGDRLESLCRSLIITELCSLVLVSRTCTKRGAAEGERRASPPCRHFPLFSISRDL